MGGLRDLGLTGDGGIDVSERRPPGTATGEPVTLETGLEAFQSSQEFHGPVESLDGHHCNDHFAQIYESHAEKFEAVVPFVRHGLERGERVGYVVDQSTEAEVRSTLADAGIDVDAALDSGALTFYTVDETYLRDGSFDPDEMIRFYADTVAEATEDYEALRLVAEMSWIADDATSVEQLMRYESKVNDLFDDEDALAICQYDRELFSPEVIRNIVRTHPHLIYDGAVCHNFYYTPPEELFGDDDPVRENDRMLRTLRDRTEAKTELARHERFLRDLYEVTASQGRSFEQKLDALFDLGCERFDLDFGFLNRVDPDDDCLEVEYASDEHDHYEVGVELPLSETYCRAAVDIEAAASIADPVEEGYDDLLVYEDFGVEGYLGTYIPVEGGADRTLAFVPDGSETDPFTEQDRAYLELMGQWLGYELNRRLRERFLRECYEVTSDPALDFEEKLHRLLDLARERMGLDAAGLTHLPEWDDHFLTEYALGYGGDGAVDASDGMRTDPGEGCYCRQVIVEDEPIGMADVRGTDWEDDEIHQEHGLTCYLGTKVTTGSTPYGTLWVGGTEPRDREFSATERTVLELMGQWVSYELERREHSEAQRELYEITAAPELDFEEKLDALFELGTEQFGLDIGGVARVHPEADRLEIEHVSERRGEFEPGLEAPLAGNYCGAAYGADGPATVTDPIAAGYGDSYSHGELGFEAYLGTHIEVDGDHDRLFFLTTTEPRDAEFSDAERTFVELLGQWVKHELERRQRERELRERTEHLSALVETTPECIKTVAADGTLLQMNPAGLEMVEADSDSDVVGECVYDLIAPEHRERFREFNERICEGERGTLEFDIVGLDGTRRHMESHAAPLHRPDGTTAHVALTRDITERKQRERELDETIAELQESEERLQLALEAGEMGMWQLDLRTGEAPVRSPRHDRIFGYEEPLDDWDFETFLDHVHPEDRERVQRRFEEGFETGEWDFECPIIGADGERRTISGRGEFYDDGEGEPVRVVGIVQDVTERKERERELERAERQFEAAFNNPSAFMGLLDPDGTVRRINETALEFAGVDEADVRGERFWETPWFAHSEELRAELRADIERAADGEYVRDEFEHRSPDGDSVIIDAMLEPVRDEDGEVVALMASGNDITERKQHERHLERKTDRLESFASMLAHELRNPVTIGQIYGQQLSSGADSEAVEYVTEAFDRIEDMIDIMLVLTRGREVVDEGTPVDLAAVTREAWDDVDAPDAELDVEADDTIRADETYVRHLFQNLFENAVEHGSTSDPEGDDSVEHGGADVTVTVGELPAGFYVADDGTGIPPEERDAVFDEGYTTAADSGGTGLGLAFVQKIAEVYDWDLAVTESEDGGARFEFRNLD